MKMQCKMPMYFFFFIYIFPYICATFALCVCNTALGVCVFTAVCVHFGWVKRRAQILSMGHYAWPYVTSLHLVQNANEII